MSSKRRLPSMFRTPIAVFLILLPFGTGCGNAIYTVRAGAAASKVAEARELGAERLAPYEYYLAQEHLEEARSEAGSADYGDAIDLAKASEGYAEQAIAVAKSARRGAGR